MQHSFLNKSKRLPAAPPAGWVTAGALLLAATAASAAHGSGPSGWSPSQLVLAGAGCPIETPDARSLMVASGRPGGAGDLDIWVIDRAAVGAPWSTPKNLPAPINSAAAEFCPAPFERSLYFISTEANPGACGGGDIYLSRQSPAGDWSEPIHLPCAPDGPNTAGTERSPSLIETWYGTFLFFSTNEGVAGADEDIYVSVMDDTGAFGKGRIVPALSTPDYQDQMPTVREINGKFEITLNSDRPATKAEPVFGGQDAYLARAVFLPYWWSKPVNAGPNVNTAANETRASLSWDGKRLYVGRGDVYVSERQ
jgi:hypothetical protein